MYEDFFKLDGRPFLAAPTISHYFPAAGIEAARQTLLRAIERGEGAGLLIGPAGTGKTLLCQLLAHDLSEQFEAVFLPGARLTCPIALLRVILHELELPFRGMDEGELRLSLLDHLRADVNPRGGLVLLVDEAHSLPWRLMEEIRLLTNISRDGAPRVRVVLAGGPLLEERFANPKMAAFSQRLAARCYLEPFNSAETAAYVRAQIAAADGQPNDIFDEDSFSTIYRASDGIPRLINQVCDHALLLASLGGVPQLTSDGIEEAWADLQQLPGPWTTQPAAAPQTQVIEFGGLDDNLDDLPEAIPFRSPESALHLAEPGVFIDQISGQLSQLDESFQPAGTIGNEYDLDFPEFGDPFNEKFAEEEVVFDPYMDAELFADLPRVTSWEGDEISSLLEGFDVSLPQPKLAELDPLPTPSEEQASADVYAVAPVRSLPAAERGGIDIDDDLLPTEAHWRPLQTPQKREFSRLFARLRKS